MPKVDIVLNIVAAAMTFGNDPRINKLYADLALWRNQLQGICQMQPDNGDVMAGDAVKYATGQGPKPRWMEQVGL